MDAASPSSDFQLLALSPFLCDEIRNRGAKEGLIDSEADGMLTSSTSIEDYSDLPTNHTVTDLVMWGNARLDRLLTALCHGFRTLGGYQNTNVPASITYDVLRYLTVTVLHLQVAQLELTQSATAASAPLCTTTSSSPMDYCDCAHR